MATNSRSGGARQPTKALSPGYLPDNVERESEIVAQSGRAGAVTISTNMAGRGTDILLGGNPDYAPLGCRKFQ